MSSHRFPRYLLDTRSVIDSSKALVECGGVMGGATEPVGTVAVALAHCAGLCLSAPHLAELQAKEILLAAPGHPEAARLLSLAHRRQGHSVRARDILLALTHEQPRWAQAHHDLALVHLALNEAAAATACLLRAVQLKPDFSDAWSALGATLMLSGDAEGADRAFAQQIRAATKDPRLMAAAVALCDEKLDIAERLLRAHLSLNPGDVAAIRMLAEVGTRLGQYADAELLLERCLELAPGFTPARHNYAIVLYRQNKAVEVLPQVERLLQVDADHPGYRNLQAAALALVGDYDLSIRSYEAVLKDHPNQPKVWLSYGHSLKTAGRQDDAVMAYRHAVKLSPSFGEAYWSLANLKMVRFSAADVTAMRAQLARTNLGEDDRLHFHFALGKALEDGQSYPDSFDHYAQANRLRRRQIVYDAAETSAQMRRAQTAFSAEMLAAHTGQGAADPDPIFIVGLPRSGSTLIEQILSSHSAVEGTMELPEIAAIARSLNGPGVGYPENLAALDGAALSDLGRRFLQRTRIHRKSGKPFFIDKMPNNFLHVGLIHLILPRAKIIDARRHPLSTCFSAFKQHFARGQAFSYDLQDLGRYYAGYVELMAHFDLVLPGRVHRIFYENMVENTEFEVRRLLDYCGLPFEAACMRFYDNGRAVRTASSEQVRQPIFRDGLDQWRKYEAWLGPLKAALGPALSAYPSTPTAADLAVGKAREVEHATP